MKDILKEIRKQMVFDWINGFHQLTPLTQNKFYKIIGPTIVGIELVSIPAINGYRPHFVIYPLWRNNVNSCLNIPLIYKYIINKKGNQFDIPYLKHNDHIEDAIESFKLQIPIKMDEDVSLRFFFEVVDHRFTDILVTSSTSEQVKLFELKFYLAVYLNHSEIVKTVLAEIIQSSKRWNITMFELWYGKLDLWIFHLQEAASDRAKLLTRIDINKKDKKFERLIVSELIS
ncbi:MAG: hypothetical protein ABIQ31_27580 [Ferruginibacter sp.]